MNYTYHGTRDLIALPERAVQTFPSGLVRVDRVYACRKNQVARFRDQLRAGNPLPLDDGAPAIDGLFIFPEPRETIRDDGFAEFRVSGYGRANTTGTITKQGVFTAFPENDFNYLSQNFIVTTVLPSSSTLSEIFEAPNIEPEREFQFGPSVTNFEFIDTTFTRVFRYLIIPAKTLTIERQIPNRDFTLRSVFIFGNKIEFENSTSQNFGAFSEYTITYRSPPVLFQFSTFSQAAS
jgi:hypothetical protein